MGVCGSHDLTAGNGVVLLLLRGDGLDAGCRGNTNRGVLRRDSLVTMTSVEATGTSVSVCVWGGEGGRRRGGGEVLQ